MFCYIPKFDYWLIINIYIPFYEYYKNYFTTIELFNSIIIFPRVLLSNFILGIFLTINNNYIFIIILFTIILILISVAFMTLLERKIMASIQERKGPTRVGLFGILQPLSDGIKLVLKETVFPRNSYFFIFSVSPILSFIFGFCAWSIVPFGYGFVISNLYFGIFFIFIISIFHIYSIILAGWSSNSKYAFLGALRSSAQLIAYDIPLGFVVLIIYICTKSLNITKIIQFQIDNGWLIVYYPLVFIIFFICLLAETNRHPFDLPEAESELVSGYNVEYSASGFALFFLGEYSSIIFASVYTVSLFLGGWDTIFIIDFGNFYLLEYFIYIFSYFIKLFIFIYLFIYIRAALPRYRYDQLMNIGWKYALPLIISIFISNIIIFKLFSFSGSIIS